MCGYPVVLPIQKYVLPNHKRVKMTHFYLSLTLHLVYPIAQVHQTIRVPVTVA